MIPASRTEGAVVRMTQDPVLGVDMNSTAETLSLAARVLLDECLRSVLDAMSQTSTAGYRPVGKTGDVIVECVEI